MKMTRVRLTGFRITRAALVVLVLFGATGTTRNALIVEFVKMQWVGASGAAELAGAGASSAVCVAGFAQLSERIVVLCAEAFDAEAADEHRMTGTGSALERSLAFARPTIMVTLLTAVIRLEETFRTLGMTFTRGQLPAFGASHALVVSRS